MKTINVTSITMTKRAIQDGPFAGNTDLLDGICQHQMSFHAYHWRPLWAWLIRTKKQTSGWKYINPEAHCREIQLGYIHNKTRLQRFGLNLNGFVGIVDTDQLRDSAILLDYDHYYDEWDFPGNTSGIIDNYFPEFYWNKRHRFL